MKVVAAFLMKLALISTGVLLNCGCTSQPESGQLPILPARFADEIAVDPLVAIDAFIDEKDFYVKYRLGGDTFYTGGSWADRISIEDIESGEPSGGPYILPLQYHQVTPWSSRSHDFIAGRVLDSEQWRSLRRRIFESVLPREGNAGIVLHFYVDDYFLYFDNEGRFQSRVLIEKPADYSIRDEFDFAALFELGFPILDEFLNERGVLDRRVVFNTGDTGAYSLPFLYVNRDLPLAVFARNEPPRRHTDRGRTVPILQTAGHFTQSHSTALVLRPVSSLYRLLFVTTGAVAETVRPDWLVALDSDPIPPVYSGPGMDLVSWEAQLDELTGRRTSIGSIEYLVDGEEFFTRLIDALSSASDSINLRTYIFDNDDYAERIGELLKRKSNEGVDVKMLFDGFGTIFSTIEEQQSLPEDWGGVTSVHGFLEKDSNIDVRQTPNPWFTGDHVKTIVVDRQIAFTGGMNIAREYRYDWHDLMMEVHGPVVDILQDEFWKAWSHAGIFGDYGYLFRSVMPMPNDAEDVGYPIRVLFTRIDDAEIFRAQRAAIRNAKRFIYVENAYFTDDAMLYELVRARRRGVDVRVIVPLVTDRGPITRNNALAANVMLEHGIRVFVYPGMSHVKAAVFDGWACLGSANWDKWSLSINKELNLATSHPEAVDGLIARVFEPDFTRSAELTEPFPERWSDFLLEFMGDYIF
jgi:cardiolipin synthase